MDYLPNQRRYLIVLMASCALAIWLGFFLLSAEDAIYLVRTFGYWWMGITAGCFAIAAYRFLRADCRHPGPQNVDWLRWLMVVVVALLLQVHEPHGFKVIMDELVLSATSMSMHFDREVFCPIQVNTIDGIDFVTGGIIDKRPYFFPFLLSVAHDLTGFRPENAFYLNAVFCFLLLGLVGYLAALLTNQNGGRLAVMLLAGLPLLAINATGGGFEVLNLCMIAVTILAAIRYLESGSATSLNFLVYCGLLLAQTRYESVLFLLPVGLVILIGWWKNRSVRLTVPLIAAPVLLVPYPLLNSIIRAYKDFWQLPADIESPFSLSFLGENLSHAVAYLFNPPSLQSNSVLLSFSGAIGLVFAMVFFVRRAARFHTLQAKEGVLFLFGLVILANFSLLMCYHWGKVDEFVVSRLTLPLFFLMALIVPFVLKEFGFSRRGWNGMVGLASLFFVLVTIPASARANPTLGDMPYRETDWFLDFVRAHRDEGAFFVIPSALPAVILQEAGCSNAIFRNRASEIDYHLKVGTYSKVYVLQRLREDLATGEAVALEKSFIGDQFTLQVIAERKFGIFYRSRINVLTGVDPQPEPGKETDQLRVIKREISVRGFDDSEKGEKLRNYIEMLP